VQRRGRLAEDVERAGGVLGERGAAVQHRQHDREAGDLGE
jgi:hypothetical protein